MKPSRFQKLSFTNWWSSTSSSVSPGSACVRQSTKKRSPVLLVAVSIATPDRGPLGIGFYNEPRLAVGTPAPQTIQAPANATVEDELATEAARKEARQSSLSVFMISEAQTQQIQGRFCPNVERGSEDAKRGGPTALR